MPPKKNVMDVKKSPQNKTKISSVGLDYNKPKIYISNLTVEQKAAEFPDGTFVLNSKNQVCVMKNGRPQFTKSAKNTKSKSICSGNHNILTCPEKDCVWHDKSKQCRMRRNASKKIIEEDKKLREYYLKHPNLINAPVELYKTTGAKSKITKLLNNLIHSYNKEDDLKYAKYCVKKINKLIDTLEEQSSNFDLHSFSLSDYSNKNDDSDEEY